MRSHSQIWKFSRRVAALRFAPSAAPITSSKPLFEKEKALQPATAIERCSEGKTHILYLAGNLAAVRNLLRREINLPVRKKKLQCASIPIANASVLRALKQSLETASGPISRRTTTSAREAAQHSSSEKTDWKCVPGFPPAQKAMRN